MYTLVSTWHDLESCRAEWLDAPDDDVVLEELLIAAQDAVLAYAPSSLGLTPESTEVPARIARAQLAQARNTWNASRVSTQGDYGSENYAMAVFPLDWHVKALIRPRTAIPVVA